MVNRFSGQKRANPAADPDNNLKLPADVTKVGAEDSLSFSALGTAAITAFTYEGVVYTISSLANTPAVTQAAIYAVLRTLEVEPIVKVSYSGGAVKFTHVGEGTVASLTIGGTARACTRKTSWVTWATSSLGVKGAVPALALEGGSSSNLATGTYNYTGNSATDATTAGTLKTDIETALAALSVTGTVKVAVDTLNKCFEVQIYAINTATFLLGGAKMAKISFENVAA